MFKTTSDNIKEWKTVFTSSVNTGFHSPIDSQHSIELDGGQSKIEFYLDYLSGESDSDDDILSDAPDSNKESTLKHTAVFVGQTQVAEFSTIPKMSNATIQAPEGITVAYQYPTHSIRHATSYEYCSSEVVQKTIDFETAVQSSNSVTTLGTYRETFSCSVGHNVSFLSLMKSIENFWTSSHHVPSYPENENRNTSATNRTITLSGDCKDENSTKENTKRKKSLQRIVSTSACKKDENSRKEKTKRKKGVTRHDSTSACKKDGNSRKEKTKRKKSVKRHDSTSACKKEKKRVDHMRKRLSFKSMWRRHWKIIYRDVMQQLRCLKGMNSDTVWTGAAEKEAVFEEIGAEMVSSQRKSAVVATSLQLKGTIFSKAMCDAGEGTELILNQHKSAAIGSSLTAMSFKERRDAAQATSIVSVDKKIIRYPTCVSAFTSYTDMINSHQKIYQQIGTQFAVCPFESKANLSLSSDDDVTTTEITSQTTTSLYQLGIKHLNILSVISSSTALDKSFVSESKGEYTYTGLDIKQCSKPTMTDPPTDPDDVELPKNRNREISRGTVTDMNALKRQTCCPLLGPCCVKQQCSSPTVSFCPSQFAERVANQIISHIPVYGYASQAKLQTCTYESGTAMTPVRIVSFATNARPFTTATVAAGTSCLILATESVAAPKSTTSMCYKLINMSSFAMKDGYNSSPSVQRASRSRSASRVRIKNSLDFYGQKRNTECEEKPPCVEKQSKAVFTSRYQLPPAPCCNDGRDGQVSDECVFVFDSPRCAKHQTVQLQLAPASACLDDEEPPLKLELVEEDGSSEGNLYKLTFDTSHETDVTCDRCRCVCCQYQDTDERDSSESNASAKELTMKIVENIARLKNLCNQSVKVASQGTCDVCNSTKDVSQPRRTIFLSSKRMKAAPQTKTETTQTSMFGEAGKRAAISETASISELSSCARYISNLLADKLAKGKYNFMSQRDDSNRNAILCQAIYRGCMSFCRRESGCQTPSLSRCQVPGNQVYANTSLGGEPEANKAIFQATCKTEVNMPYKPDVSPRTCECRVRQNRLVARSSSVTNICRGHEKEDLKSVYYRLSALEGRVRRMKMRQYY